MSLWLLIALFGLIKLPLAALMLWLTIRDDVAMQAPAASAPGDDGGGSHAPHVPPRRPHPPWPGSPRPRGPQHALRAHAPARSACRRGVDCALRPRAPSQRPTRVARARTRALQ